MSSTVGTLSCNFVPTFKIHAQLLLGEKKSPTATGKRRRGQECEVWNLSVVNQHVGGGGQVTVALLWDLETGEMFDGSPHN